MGKSDHSPLLHFYLWYDEEHFTTAGPMSQIAQTTKVHRKGAPADLDLEMEATALAKRVTDRIRQPTTSGPQMVLADDYEPQDVVKKSKTPKH